MPNMKADPAALATVNASSANAGTIADRQANGDRANRSDPRTAAAAASTDQSAPDLWLLPVKNYKVSAPFGPAQGGVLPGIDLAVAEGTPYFAAHAGTVTLARWDGGNGFAVLVDAGNGTTVAYGHSSKLLVHEGQKVQAGDLLGLTGQTGYTFGPHLHFEIRQNNAPVNPQPFMLAHGVDIDHQTQAIDS
jgi:murein DD-endopeptidase MepM/ murein hydrolase activator NlpD